MDCSLLGSSVHGIFQARVLWDAVKTTIRGKFRALEAFLKKQIKISIYLPPKRIRKRKKTKPQVSRRNKIIKMREEINKIETKIIEKINKIKS